MIEKLGRKYELTIYPSQYLKTSTDGKDYLTSITGQKAIQITNPFTLEFNISRKALASANTATFRIYNLNEDTRNQIFKDYFDPLNLRRVTLRAGYFNPLPIIFDGNIKWCTSCRVQGNTNFISEIEAYDYSFSMQNSHSNWTLAGPSVRKQEVVDRLINDLSSLGVSRGYVSQYSDSYQKKTISDYTWNGLKNETNGACFIDNGKVNVLLSEEYFIGQVNEISSDSGLLGSPKRSQAYVIVEMLFEPTLEIGQLVELNTLSQKIFNGQYKVVGINHSGTISDAVSGKCQTNLNLYNFTKASIRVNRVESLV